MARFCIRCGSELPEGASFCSKCNTENNPTTSNEKKSNGLAIAAFIISLISLFLCLGSLSWLSLILSIVGVVSAKKLAGEGKGLAIAGIIISVLGVLEVLVFVILISLFGVLPFKFFDEFEDLWENRQEQIDGEWNYNLQNMQKELENYQSSYGNYEFNFDYDIES